MFQYCLEFTFTREAIPMAFEKKVGNNLFFLFWYLKMTKLSWNYFFKSWIYTRKSKNSQFRKKKIPVMKTFHLHAKFKNHIYDNSKLLFFRLLCLKRVVVCITLLLCLSFLCSYCATYTCLHVLLLEVYRLLTYHSS